MSVVLRDVSRSFGNVKAVEAFSLSAEDGEFLSIVGPSGCGKTTTLRLIAGFITPDSGEIAIGGRSMWGVKVRDRKVGIVFQNYALFPNMTAYDNVAFGLRVRKMAEDEVRQRADEYLALVGLGDRGAFSPRELSGGQQQRVALARALAIDPEVLLLDEPLSALDAKVRNNLRFEIKRIQRESGITTIYVTHDQEEALSISDRVALMEQGRIAQVGSPWEIYSRPQSAFVADFVGVNNLLEAEAVGPGRVRWRGRELQVEDTTVQRGPCLLSIRPERLEPHCGDEGAVNVLKGVVAGQVFLGPLLRLALDVEDQRMIVDLLNAEERRFTPGDPLCVRFDAADGRLVPLSKEDL
ncbi:MAG: ABC transporter ATP-binding protein [Synergistales bacterium]|nr:ABC transporter ATP-binding protein [Synergistales bacterium]